MTTYNIDDDIAFTDFIAYLEEEKPDKTIDGDIITLPDFKVKVFPKYRSKLKDLFEKEYEASETGVFDISKYDTEIVENHGYKFITFKE